MQDGDEQRGQGAPAGPLRLLFVLAWLALQTVLILTAGRRNDGAFGFRMFSESSTARVALYREVMGPEGRPIRVHVEGGMWAARDGGGMVRRWSWYDRVRRPELGAFDTEIPASYGAATQVARLQAALDDVAAHIGDDAETLKLHLDVVVRRNGREPVTHHLVSGGH